MSVVSIPCSAKKFLKVAAAVEALFVRDDGSVVITQRHHGVLTWTNSTDETPLTQVSRTPPTATRSHESGYAHPTPSRAVSPVECGPLADQASPEADLYAASGSLLRPER